MMDLAYACFCGCCCLHDERTLIGSQDCTCKKRLEEVIEDFEALTRIRFSFPFGGNRDI